MNKFLIIRHAPAESAETALAQGRVDAQRTLTTEGRDRFAETLPGLARLVEQIDILASSPYVRALQTADMLAHHYKQTPLVLDELAPGVSPTSLLDWCREHPRTSRIALVGHEPDLSLWLGWMLTGQPQSFVQLKKGAGCMIEFLRGTELHPGAARLLWVLQPKQLRLVGMY